MVESTALCFLKSVIAHPKISCKRHSPGHAEFRRVEQEIGLNALKTGVLFDPFHHEVDIFLQLIIGAGCLDDELDRARCAALAEGGA